MTDTTSATATATSAIDDAALADAFGTADAPVWTCPAGSYRGIRQGAVDRARSIRYATAERYQLPVLAGDLPGGDVVDASERTPACPQVGASHISQVMTPHRSNLPQEEDCHRLSITIPANTPADAKLPVVVWIHGGAFITGGGDVNTNDPVRAVEEQNVIMVTPTFRLGMFGFLGSMDEESNGGKPSIPWNLGLYDIIVALHWVKRNIEGFGGDSDNITLGGQSAGADAVLGVLTAEGADLAQEVGGARGLFHRAIVQSAPIGYKIRRHQYFPAMVESVGPPPADAPLGEMVSATHTATQAAMKINPRMGGPFGLNYNQAPLPGEGGIDEALKSAASRIDLLMGRLTRETAMYMQDIKSWTTLREVPAIGRNASESFVKKHTADWYSSVKDATDLWASGGGRGYRYLMEWGAPENPYFSAHTSDVPLLLGTKETWKGSTLLDGLEWNEIDATGRRFRTVWGDFVRTGKITDPGRVKYFMSITEFGQEQA